VKILSVVGARPQFVKAALLSREFAAAGLDERLVHTGQHYDVLMSDVFFSGLELPEPRYHLGVGSASHAVQTAEIMMRLESIVIDEAPDCVLVYGDTNSTVAGALVAAKLDVPLVHVEAGLRSFDRRMPEEINRLVTDRLSQLLLAPAESAARQLRKEGMSDGVVVVGDLMVDLALEARAALPPRPAVLDRFGLGERAYAVATIHRAGNTDDTIVFARLIAGLHQAQIPIIFPVHPRTRRLIDLLCVGATDNIVVCEPLSYHDMLALQTHAACVVTDSGGMQKEAITLGTPCVTLRDTTEWTETLEAGWNVLAGSDPETIAAAVRRKRPQQRIAPYGSGGSARRIVDAMLDAVPVGREAVTCAS